MTDPDLPIAITLACLRRHGHLPVDDVQVADVEQAAASVGRQADIVDDDGNSVVVLGWQGAAPAASAQAPRLSRRALNRRETKTLIVTYALLTDPRTDRQAATTDQVLTAVELLTARPGNIWVLPALRDSLPRAGLLTACELGWRPGPAMLIWDIPTRDVMTHAARRLRGHPLWPVSPDA
ncbi:hypothetical protein HH310_19840 [Actinoplanes sp. TBRC 11911]|uniref:hypothetical protein n=1 Tax=Actinoplanes sp. TBRC 11911 TaxID=2729386 RepID=UPI00145C48F6|nr:hypothetical protein [Actinoplanes sp. TBRC 11911]NMO53429.1 hypothetical protein [Actinoplanes sp. TBRC 11911]